MFVTNVIVFICFIETCITIITRCSCTHIFMIITYNTVISLYNIYHSISFRTMFAFVYFTSCKILSAIYNIFSCIITISSSCNCFYFIKMFVIFNLTSSCTSCCYLLSATIRNNIFCSCCFWTECFINMTPNFIILKCLCINYSLTCFNNSCAYNFCSCCSCNTIITSSHRSRSDHRIICDNFCCTITKCNCCLLNYCFSSCYSSISSNCSRICECSCCCE